MVRVKCPKCGYEWEAKRTCMTCRWARWNGPHLGCYYGGKWRTWLSQKDARVFAICEEKPWAPKEWMGDVHYEAESTG